MEYLFIYCLQLFNFLAHCTEIILFILLILFIAFVVFKMATIVSDDGREKETVILIYKFIKKLFCISLVVFILLSFVPTKNTLLLMGGLYLGKKAVNTIITDEKIKKIDTIINLELDKRIKELKEEEEGGN